MTLRARLTIAAVLGIGVILATNGLVVYTLTRDRMIGEIEAALLTVADATRPVVRWYDRERWRRSSDGDRRPRPPWSEADGRSRPPSTDESRDGTARPPETDPDTDPRASGPERRPRTPPFWEGHWVQIWKNGEPLVRSENLGDESLPLTVEDRSRASRFITLPDGHPALAVTRHFTRNPRRSGRDRSPEETLREPNHFTITVARDASELQSNLRTLRWVLGISTAAAISLCGLALFSIVSRQLRPLRELQIQIADVDAGELNRTFSLDRPPAELEPVLDQLNDLLSRIRQAFEREQSFTADAAHELRTPLAGLRSTIELALIRPRDSAEYRQALSECQEVVADLDGLVERLLELARAGSQEAQLRRERTSLGDLLEESWSLAESTASRRGVTLETNPREMPVVLSDPLLLRRIVGNLLENAALYADEGTPVRVTYDAGRDPGALVFSNRLEEGHPELGSRAVEPFWRGDPARSEAGVHVGVGLTLCDKLAETLGLTLRSAYSDGLFSVSIVGFERAEESA